MQVFRMPHRYFRLVEFFPFTVAVSIQMVREKATWADFIMAEHHVCEI